MNQNSPTPDLPPDPAAAAQRLGEQMKALHRYVSGQLMRAMQDQLQGDDMSFSQMTALHQLRAHAALSIGGLADLTGLSLPAASHLTDRLVQRGFAERRENPDDRRAKLLALTADGHAFLDSMDRRFNETYQQVFGRVGVDLLGAAADTVAAVMTELRAQDARQPDCTRPPIPEDTE